jgi:uncharacterized iron-regulated protein
MGHASSVLSDRFAISIPARLRTKAAAIRSACLLALAAAISCGPEMSLRPEAGFSQPLGREHPWVGRIYASRSQRFVPLSDLRAALAQSDLVVLGETHDNRDHHRLEATLMAAFAEAHGKVRVGFEMLDDEQGRALTSIPPKSADELARRVDWGHSGWPDFAMYRVLFERVFAAGATIVAASPDKAQVRASMGGLDASEARALHLDVPLPAAQAAAQRTEIRDSHCGQAPDAMVEPMQRAQSFKDAWMARALLADPIPSMLIAGRGHARNDRGVPLFWRRAGHASISIALIEVEDEPRSPSAYDVGAFDFVVFTPRVSDEDPCARFRRELERMRANHAD